MGLKHAVPGTLVHEIRGATVVFEPFHRAAVACLQVWIRAGAARESERERGAAHFLEHLLFQTRPDRFGGRGIGAVAEDGGGSTNAWTSQDFTAVYVICPAMSFDEVAAAVLHCVLAPDVAPAVIERERGVILQEIAREEENPGLTCMRLLFEERYAGHPYGRRVIGSRESVSSLDRATILGFHDRHYRTGNLVIAVAGDLTPSDVFARVDAELAPFEREAEISPPIPLAGGIRPGNRHEARPTVESHFGLAFAIPHLEHPDVPAVDCLSGILGDTRGSVLQEWRRTSGLVNDVSTVSYTPPHGGTFLITGSTPPARLDATIDSLRDCVSAFLSAGPAQAAVAAVREEQYTSSLRADETVLGRANRMAYEVASTGRLGFYRRYLASVMSLGVPEISAAGRRYLSGRPPSLVVVGPEPYHQKALVFSRPRRGIRPPARPSRTVLPEGTIVLHLADSTHPTVAVRLHGLGGLEWESAGDNGLHALLGRMYLCGAGGRSAQSRLRDFDALGAVFGANAGHSTFAAWLDVPVGTLMPAVSLMGRGLAHPDLDPADLDRERDFLKEAIRSRIDRPQALLNRELAARVFANHPYGLDPLGTEESLDRIGRAELERAVRRLVDPATAIIGVVGDCDPVEVARALLGDAESPDSAASRPDNRPDFFGIDTGRVVDIEGPFRQSHIGLAWPGVDQNSELRLPIRVLAASLSMMSGPLFAVLRDRLGIAYSFGASATSLRLGGWIQATAAVRPGMEARAFEAIRNGIQEILDGGRETETMLARGAAWLAGSEEIAFQKKSAVAHWMCSHEGTALGYDSFLTIAEQIRALPPRAIIEAGRNLLQREPVAVVLRPVRT